MQELGRQRSLTLRSAALQRHLVDGQGFERPSGPTVQLLARDAFVAETAIKLDQLGGEIKSLLRELQLLKSDIAALKDDASRGYRFSEFLDREHKIRGAKLDDLAKKLDYFKLRLDALDGASKGDYHAFANFEAISRRLTELGELERSFRDVTWKLKFSTGMFTGSVLVWFLVLLFA